MNLVDLAEKNYKKFGEYTYIVFKDKEYTNLYLLQAAKRLANGLKSIGVKPGDNVVVMALNSPEVIISYQGILRAGAVIVPVMSRLEAKEVDHILRNSESVAIITSKDLLGKVYEARQGIETLKHIIVIDDEDVPGTINFHKLVEQSSDEWIPIDIQENDLAVILYTSGTTGVPKGVMLTHKNLYSNAMSSASIGDTKRSDVSLSVLPLSHSYGLTVMNTTYYYGNKLILMGWWDTEEACRLIEKYKVTGFSGVPAMFAMMLNSPVVDKYDLSSLEKCGSGSAPLPVEVMHGFEKKFNCPIREGYGLSEASPVVSTHYPNRPRKPGSIGQPLPDVQVRIVDDGGRDVPVGEIGELLVKGPNVSPGYYKNPEATANAIKDGWLFTGDMAKMDEDGYLYIVERKKDLIIRGGFNVYPRDVEEVLYKHPAVLEAAVIGVPDPIQGEEIKAFVVVRDGQQVTAEEIIEHTQKYLAKFKCPRYVEFIKEIPRNPSGKILRKHLRQLDAKSAVAVTADS